MRVAVGDTNDEDQREYNNFRVPKLFIFYETEEMPPPQGVALDDPALYREEDKMAPGGFRKLRWK